MAKSVSKKLNLTLHEFILHVRSAEKNISCQYMKKELICIDIILSKNKLDMN